MEAWIAQWKAYEPGCDGAVNDPDEPPAIEPELKAPPSAVTVWVAVPWLTTVTVVPGPTVAEVSEKSRATIVAPPLATVVEVLEVLVVDEVTGCVVVVVPDGVVVVVPARAVVVVVPDRVVLVVPERVVVVVARLVGVVAAVAPPASARDVVGDPASSPPGLVVLASSPVVVVAPRAGCP